MRPRGVLVHPLDRFTGGRWTLLTLGSSLGTSAENHLPFDDYDRIMPAGEPR